ncbi:hypothetical protein [Bacillus sp. MRMR6]|uniref:hypothetical protein n=1 Tax=Bacillus sp. MRMR6 TaxID=1928617 RepID=UPI0009530A6C|nr:hypothetical protein [Bacillus sp. MRMR6]OLS33730.1 hypothetical protein BTR25_24365 [Bacillus sp. MRMR6]
MEWTLTGLLGISALLLVISLYKTRHASKVNHREVDMVHISVMKEINSIQDSIRHIELDVEVITKEAGIQLSSDRKVFLREVLDLYKRNYSIESIAEKNQVTVSEIEQILAPFQESKDEGRIVAYEN